MVGVLVWYHFVALQGSAILRFLDIGFAAYNADLRNGLAIFSERQLLSREHTLYVRLHPYFDVSQSLRILGIFTVRIDAEKSFSFMVYALQTTNGCIEPSMVSYCLAFVF